MIRNNSPLSSAISLLVPLMLMADTAMGTGAAVMEAPAPKKGDKTGDEKRAQKDAGQKAAESLLPFFDASNKIHILSRDLVGKSIKGLKLSTSANLETFGNVCQVADELEKHGQTIIDNVAAQIKTIVAATRQLASKDYTLTGGAAPYQVIQELLGVRASRGQANSDMVRRITGVAVVAK